MPKRNKKGSILFIAVAMIMVVAVLATVMLRIISNQARLTHHQVSRIQAQYAAKAAIIYTIDKLRRNNDPGWPATVQFTKTMCRSGCDINEGDLPGSVQQIDITVYGPTAPGSQLSGTRRITARATYTYTP